MVELKENLVIADRFRLVRMIGKGGMGSVWQARHLGLDMDCAIKFIEGDVSKMVDIKSRFEREAKAAAQLKSPHVVQVIDHGDWEGTPFIAMELLDGEDLAHRIASRRLHYVEICTIVGQVCRALSRAHQMGIVHRDLKPDNIFLVRDDDREIAKVLDFGIAKHTKGEISGSNTKTGTMLGTPYYMSPEQAQGTKQVDARSDLWSLAIIVYQAMCGSLPFESEALGDLLVKIIVAPVPIPSHVAPHMQIPASFDHWWMRASARDPEHRFQSAREFSESLAFALGVSNGEDSTGIMRMRAQQFAPQQTQALPGGFITGSGNRPNTPMEPASSGQVPVGPVTMPTFAGTDVPAFLPPKRSPAVLLGAIGALVTVAVAVGGFVMWNRQADARSNAGQGTPPEVPTVEAPVTAPNTAAPLATVAGPVVTAVPVATQAANSQPAPSSSTTILVAPPDVTAVVTAKPNIAIAAPPTNKPSVPIVVKKSDPNLGF